MRLNTAALATTLKGLLPHAPRDDWGAGSESLCQFIELIEQKAQPSLIVEDRTAEKIVNALASVSSRWRLDNYDANAVSEGLAVLRTQIEELQEALERERAAA